MTKPFHKSQRIIEENEYGSKVFETTVVLNFELDRMLLGRAEAIKVLSLCHLVFK